MPSARRHASSDAAKSGDGSCTAARASSSPPGASPAGAGAGALTAAGALLGSIALAAYHGGFDWLPLLLLSGAAAATLASSDTRVARRQARLLGPFRAEGFLLALALLGVGWHAFGLRGGVGGAPPAPILRGVAGLAGLSLVLFSRRMPRWVERARFPAVLVLFLAMSALAILRFPRPDIDVWWFRQLGAVALSQGNNPYAVAYPNIYGDLGFYDPSTATSRAVFVYPYPPLTVLVDLGSFLLFDDVRFGLALALAGGAWVLCRAVPGRLGELAAIALLFQPQNLYVLERAWTEPLVLTAFVLFAAWLRRQQSGSRAHPLHGGLALGLLAIAKQYSPLLLVPLIGATTRPSRVRVAVIATAVVAAVALPFLAWNGHEFVRDIALAHVGFPFRYDSISWLVPVATALERPVSGACGFVAAGVALALTARGGASPGMAVRSAAGSFLLFLLFNKQAFVNYYWLAVGLLIVATALTEGVDEDQAAARS